MAIVPSVLNLVNGSNSKIMNVNGAITPVIFSYSPGSDINGPNSVELIALTVLLESTGTDTFSKFGKINSLTNGFKVELSVSGTTSQVCLVKDNADLVTFFRDNNFGSSATGTLGAAVGFGASVDAFTGTLLFNDTSLVLQGTDAINITVQDDLSQIGTLVCSLAVILQNA